jgi:hypothetical protein
LIVLDTNVVSDILRAEAAPEVVAWSRLFPRTTLFTTIITEAELRYGIACLPSGARRTALEASINAILGDWLGRQSLPLNSDATIHYAAFRARRKALGNPVHAPDALIAGIAIAHGAAAIATRDVADFEGCGLPIINPWDA